jgi:hypothetical protein
MAPARSSPNRDHSIPLNYRTLVFSFLAGSALSLPIGFLIRGFFKSIPSPPEWIAPWYFGVCIGSVVLLPIWSEIFLKNIAALRIEILPYYFLVLALLTLMGLLIPAV